jgi:hypothetical protein
MERPNYTLLVNSCDSFEDCWVPFFTLLDRFWQGQRPGIILNTEKKQFEFDGLHITSSTVNSNRASRMTWSECLAQVLEKVPTPIVLYMQEDYFLESPVDVELIESMVQLMLDQPEIAHIGLTPFGSMPPFTPSAHPRLERIGARAKYRISTQAGLWRPEALKSYIRPWETGWMFELFGTLRSWRRQDLFLTLSRGGGNFPLVYQHTGIVKGQWSKFVPSLFAREKINVDFQMRGFFDDTTPAWLRKAKLMATVIRRPADAFRSLF